MPPTPCTHTTRAGDPCRAWAIKDTQPAACVAHLPRGDPPPTKHGFYSSAILPDELAALVLYADDMTLDDEIGCARIALRRALKALSAPDDDRPFGITEFARLAAVVFAGSRTVARLLRDKRAISGEAADGIAGALATALDELGSDWGRDL